jgi:hypothetical protein
MAQKAAHELTKVVSHFKPDAWTVGANNGTGIDCEGFREVLFVVDYGTADTSVDFKVQGSSDNGVSDSFADITSAAITQMTTGAEIALLRINCSQTERYLRGVLTLGATEDVGVIALLSHPATLPVTQTADQTVNPYT